MKIFAARWRGLSAELGRKHVKQDGQAHKRASEDQDHFGNHIVESGFAFEAGANVRTARHGVAFAGEKDQRRKRERDDHGQDKYDVITCFQRKTPKVLFKVPEFAARIQIYIAMGMLKIIATSFRIAAQTIDPKITWSIPLAQMRSSGR